jgi:hypothetical protein
VDRDLAKHVVTVGFHSLALLEGLIPLLKDHCSEAEYNEYLKSIATVSGYLMTDLFNKVFDEYPDLENRGGTEDPKIRKIYLKASASHAAALTPSPAPAR